MKLLTKIRIGGDRIHRRILRKKGSPTVLEHGRGTFFCLSGLQSGQKNCKPGKYTGIGDGIFAIMEYKTVELQVLLCQVQLRTNWRFAMKKMLKAKKGRGKQSVAYRAMGLVLSAAVALGMPRAGVAAVRRGGGGQSAVATQQRSLRANDDVARVTIDGESHSYALIDDAWDAATAQGVSQAEITLLANASASKTLEVGEDDNITFCGNGFELTSNSDLAVIYVQGGVLTITGGTFTASDTTIYCLLAQSGKVVLNGGTFIGNPKMSDSAIISAIGSIGSLLGDGYVYRDANGTVIKELDVTGLTGMVTVKTGRLCSHEWADGVCGKCQKQAEASVDIGGRVTYYANFTTACDAAAASQQAASVTVLKDVSVIRPELELSADSPVSINGGGHTVSGCEVTILKGSVTIQDLCLLNSLSIETEDAPDTVTVVLTGCTIDIRGNMQDGNAVHVKGGTLKMADCTVAACLVGIAAVRGRVEIEGGTVMASLEGFEEGGSQSSRASVGLKVKDSDKGTADVVLSGGTFSGDTAAILVDGPGAGSYAGGRSAGLTLGGLLKAEYAYFHEDGTPITGKLQETQLEGTVTVKRCTQHSGQDQFTHVPGTTTHTGSSCPVCGITVGEEDCSYGEDGTCVCGSTLSAVLTGADGLVYNGAAHTPGVAVTHDGEELAAEYYDVVYTNNSSAGSDAAKAAITGKAPLSFHKELSFSIAPKSVSPSIDASGGSTAKIYDGTASVSDGLSIRLDGLVDGDAVTAAASYAYDSAAAGDDKTITAVITGLAGEGAANYKLAADTAVVAGKIEKAGQQAPEAPKAAEADIRDTAVTLTAARENAEYSMDGANWQDSPEFTGLTPGHTYTFYARLKGDGNHHPSASSAGTVVTTKKAGTDQPGGSTGSGSGSTGGGSSTGSGNGSPGSSNTGSGGSGTGSGSSSTGPGGGSTGSGSSTGAGSGSTGGSGSSGGSSMGNSSGTDTGSSGKPIIKDSSGREGWDAIRVEAQKVMEAPGGDKTVAVDMNGASAVPGSLLTEIRGRDVTMEFDFGGGITWTIKGTDIKAETVNDTDLSVTAHTGGIPQDVLERAADGLSHLELRLAHDGAFGFSAALSFRIHSGGSAGVAIAGSDGAHTGATADSGGAGSTEDYTGMYANLFYYNPLLRGLEFISAGRVGEGGLVSLPFHHASDYTVILSVTPMGGSDLPDQPQDGTQAGGSGETPGQTQPGQSDGQDGSARAAVKSVKLSKTVYTYNGKAKKPSVIAVDTDGRRITGSNYALTYRNNKKVGKATAVVTFKGKYSGTVTKTFTIRPAGTSIKKTAAAADGFTVTWAKQAVQTAGYQLQYSENASFKGKRTHSVFVKKPAGTKASVKKQKAGTKYYVRIRTYQTVKADGKSTKIYSAWSKVVRVKTLAAASGKKKR